MNEPAIRVLKLTKNYNEFCAVDHIDFSVPQGITFGFLGPNGAGKTTTIKMLCTLLRPTEGEAFVAGYDVLKNPMEVRRTIGIIFQEQTLDDRLTAYENLKFHGILYGLGGPYLEQRTKVIYNVAEAYFKFLEAQSVKKTKQSLLDAGQRHLQLAEGFVKTGEKPKLDLLKAQAVYSSAHFDLLKAKQDEANAKKHLDAMMGVLNPPDYTIREDYSLPPFNLDITGAKAMAFQLRPQLLVAHAKLVEAKARLTEIRTEGYPVIYASGLLGWVGSEFPPGRQSWTMGMSLNWPLFEGNLLTHRSNEAVALQRSAEADEKSAFLQVDEELEVSFRSFNDAKERLEVARDEVSQAEEASKLAEGRYKVGLASFLEVADAVADLASAKQHEVEALTDLRVSLAALKKSIGIEEP